MIQTVDGFQGNKTVKIIPEVPSVILLDPRDGHDVVTIWESEINWNKELVKDKIRASRKLVTPTVLHADAAEFNSLDAHQDWSEKVKELWFKKPRKKVEKVEKKCENCGKSIYIIPSHVNRTKFCSIECYRNARKHYINIADRSGSRKCIKPTKEELEQLVKEKSFVQIGKMFNVCGGAVVKWCKSYGINHKPHGRGYWAKEYAKRKQNL